MFEHKLHSYVRFIIKHIYINIIINIYIVIVLLVFQETFDCKLLAKPISLPLYDVSKKVKQSSLIRICLCYARIIMVNDKNIRVI